MCKIWLESIRPLRIYACVKTRFMWIFINISICLSFCLSVRFFVAAICHGFGAILNGSNDVILQLLVPFGGRFNIAPY